MEAEPSLQTIAVSAMVTVDCCKSISTIIGQANSETALGRLSLDISIKDAVLFLCSFFFIT